jgi:hypothetical protein
VSSDALGFDELMIDSLAAIVSSDALGFDELMIDSLAAI